VQPNDSANFIVVKDLVNFEVAQTYIHGNLVAENGISFIPHIEEGTINQFNATFIQGKDLSLSVNDYPTQNGNIPVIEAIDGQLITHCLWLAPSIENEFLVSNTQTDTLKIVVYNRYFKAPPKIAFIKNFGFQEGAIASTVAHDSHNIIAVGVDDESIARAINLVIQEKGGVSCVSAHDEKVLGLPVAGLMSNEDPYEIAANYTIIDKMSKQLGSSLGSPFMTLSFMALLVIPHLKLSDKGLFDGDQFKLY
jgi:adenine deaminase